MENKVWYYQSGPKSVSINPYGIPEPPKPLRNCQSLDWAQKTKKFESLCQILTFLKTRHVCTRCILPDASSQMHHPTRLLPDASSQMPSPLPNASSQTHPLLKTLWQKKLSLELTRAAPPSPSFPSPMMAQTPWALHPATMFERCCRDCKSKKLNWQRSGSMYLTWSSLRNSRHDRIVLATPDFLQHKASSLSKVAQSLLSTWAQRHTKCLRGKTR